jgi:pre-mRNA-processing factor 17
MLEQVSSAPDVHVTETDLEQADTRSLVPAAAARSIGYNVARSIMHAPVVGPANPADLSRGVSSGARNHWSGHAQDAHLSSFAFEEQYHTFAKTGNAIGPGSGTSVGRGHEAPSESQPGRPKEHKRQRVSESARPLTGIALDRPFVLKTRQPWAEKDIATGEEDLTEEQQKYIESLKMDKDAKKSLVSSEDVSIFHGSAGEDYQGRSWIDEPAGLRAERGENCFVPKRLLHTWTGQSKGVNAIRFLPHTGHLLLSAGLDGTAKIWTTLGNRECMRTYIGHTKGIRDCYFAEQGKKFVTAAYDRAIKLWDTESGNMLQKFDAKNATAFSVRTHPSHPDIVLAGMSNKKILQFDARSGEIVQEYDYHLDAVNTITFFDGGQKFISTSGTWDIIVFGCLIVSHDIVVVLFCCR